MNKYKKILCLLLIAAFLMPMTACDFGSKSVSNLDSVEYKEIEDEIDKIIKGLGGNSLNLSITKEFKEASDEKRAEMAIDLADDMAQAQLFGIVNSDMMALGGEAVKAYPHPLLLNNYGAMLIDTKNIDDALFFFHLAEAQAPDNPILLTNIANIYLEKEDFSAAEDYARKAISAASDFGAAYQVLTTIYMQKGQHKLAAYYLFKSTEHCFNDISEFQFMSFLNAVEELDPEEDDYPVTDEQIEELRKIATQNVDTNINESVDTPSAQLTIKQFPQIVGIDNLRKSYTYLDEELNKTYDKSMETKHKIMDLTNKIEATDKKKNSENKTGVLIYPVEKNLRQIYAFKVLKSYYVYKLEHEKRKYLKEEYKISGELDEKMKLVHDEHQKKWEKMREGNDELVDKYISEAFAAMINKGEIPSVSEVYKALIAQAQVKVDEQAEVLKYGKEYANDVIKISEEYHKNVKQLLEEFWLKAGGLLKCLVNEDIFKLHDLERQQIVYDYANVMLEGLKYHADNLRTNKWNLEMAEGERDMWINILKGIEGAEASNKPDNQDKAENKEDYKGEDTIPDIEEEAFSEYKENNELPAVGAEVDVFGFSGSASYDGERDNISVSANAPVGGIGGDYNRGNGSKEAYVVHGVSAWVKADWFTDRKAVKEALKGTAAGKVLGAIGLAGASGSKMEGEYLQTDSNKRITDRGLLKIRESTVSYGPFSKTDTVSVKKSLMTGFALKKTSTKYRFFFVTVQK